MEIIDKFFVKYTSPKCLSIDSYVIDKVSISGNTKIKTFFENLKDQIVKDIYSISKELYGFQKSKQVLNEFYCNPYNYDFNVLRIKNDLIKGISFSGQLNVIGIWISDKSFGPYFTLDNVDSIKYNNKFIESDDDNRSVIEMDSDEEVEYVIKNNLNN